MNFESILQMLVLGRFDLTDRNTWLTIILLIIPYMRNIFKSVDWKTYFAWPWNKPNPGATDDDDEERVIQMYRDIDGYDYPRRNGTLQQAILFKLSREVSDWKKCSMELSNGENILKTPEANTWTQINDKLWININHERTEHESKYIYTLRGKNIDTYVTDAIREYTEFNNTNKDVNRYLYMMLETKKELSRFKRYVLSDDNTFDTLHIPNKDGILNLINNFSNREGKFAIPGYPYKLGFLLHGPPGTGKSSFIKALSHHTGRHIVLISLEKVSTNQDLLSLVHDRVYHVGYDTKSMGFQDAIFVFEDIDAACDIVKKREDNDNTSEKTILPSNAINCDQLNLSGILNMLDGILDSPGRIVIMTTNHPDFLDPALIRPGRVNVQLNLSYIRPTEAEAMMRQYFPSVTEFRDKDFSVFEYRDISPATLEAMCAQYEDPHILLSSLRS